MKAGKIAFLLFLLAGLAISLYWFVSVEGQDKKGSYKGELMESEDDPDLPTGSKIGKEEYLRLRTEQTDAMRGFDTAKPDSRTKAIRDMEEGERRLAAERNSLNQPEAAMWQPLGPAPIPVSSTTSYSGRVASIAVHPTNPNIVYVGTAQGGLYRTLNGGASWTPLMDSALSLAIGAVAISPSDPTTVFVGTGEAGLCGSGCFIGVGLYRITNADTAPVLSPVLNRNATGTDVFSGRAISEIIVHPTDPNILFVGSTSGVAGIGSTTAGLVLPNAGLYRTTNAMSASPTFEKLTIQGTVAVSRPVIDLAIEPNNPSRLIAAVIGTGGDGGIYVSNDALNTTPTFTRTLTTGDGSSLGRAELAVNKVAATVTVYAATGTANGTLFKSVDGGATFVTAVANGYCSPQCFYDIAVAVDPNDANRVYLGGSPALVFGRSTNGGTSFINSSAGLHVDTQAITIAPSEPNTIYFGSDGGIWKSINGGSTWLTLNNTTFSATQFTSLALHPIDRNYLLGGTQDNGTQFLSPNNTTWVRSDGGDGGFAVIDQSSPNTTNVTAYHTFFNSTGSQIGFSRATTTVVTGDPGTTGDPNWGGLLGCGGTPNGINCADAVLFYAPMAGGPGTPNTLYFGTNRLYRSADKGTTMIDVSGTLPARVSAIAIAPQDDNVRLVGLTNGGVYASYTNGTTMVNVTGAVPARYIGRAAIDPTNINVAYVALNGFGLPAGQHIWKTTNFSSDCTWVPAGNGIPDVPVNAFVVDPQNTQNLYAGTDIGVFRSTDGGANWTPFSDNLPRVAVFGMELQPVHRVLKIATHGRGVWEYNLNAPNNRAFADFDGDGKSDVSVFRPENGTWYILGSQNGISAAQFGLGTDKLVPADYDGDGKTDLAVYRNGTWYLQRSTAGFTGIAFGAADDIPQPSDFSGDGKADLAVFRPSNGTWYVLNLANNQFTAAQFGQSGDKPVVGDYDGDGKADYAVFRSGTWYLQRSTAGFTGVAFGLSDDKLVPADYDGDLKTDIAVYRGGTWYLQRSTAGFTGIAFGVATDFAVPGDYDSDGKADVSVFRNGTWYLQRSTAGFSGVAFGASTDKPIENAYVQ